MNFKHRINKAAFWLGIPLISSIALSYTPAIAESQPSAIDNLCNKFPHNSVCKNKDSYISLDTWKQTETVCSLATQWQEKKCQIVVDGDELLVHIEDGAISPSQPNILKTKAIAISLDEIFTFDTQWWLASVEVNKVRPGKSGLPDLSSRNYGIKAGTFANLQIGYVPQTNQTKSLSSEFLTVSSKNLHQTIEQVADWRYYLPDLATFERQLKLKSDGQNSSQNTADNLAKLEQTNKCQGCNLENADLAGKNLEGVDLAGTNLAGANLAGAKLKDAYLVGANLDGANLNGADLETAKLTFASLVEADLYEANLQGANLKNASLQSADLSAANLKAKDLEITSLENANLDGAILAGADLRCVNFQSASLINSDLSDADLSNCKVSKGKSSSQLSYLELNGTKVAQPAALNELRDMVGLITGIFSAAANPGSAVGMFMTTTKVKFSLASNLTGANLTNANLTDANLKQAKLIDANLSQATIDSAKFELNNLSHANFLNTDVSEVDFKYPVLICEAIFADEFIYEDYCYEEEEG